MSIYEIGILCVIYICATAIPIVMIIEKAKNKDMGLTFLDPVINYWKNWPMMNWFGAIFWTIVLNIVLWPYAICYWFYKLCTIGRKQNK